MKYAAFFTLFLLLLYPVMSHADKIVLAADEWCPYNCIPNSAQEGYMVDIARTIFEKAGHSVEYKTVNWARAINDARSGKITGIIGAVRDEAPDFIFPANSLGATQNHFYVLKQNTWRFKDINSLRSIKLGVVNGYAYNPDMLSYINSQNEPRVHKASGEFGLKNNINMVMEKHLDALIEDKNVFMLTANKMNVFNQFTDAGSSGTPNAIYIAFSPALPQAQQYADLLSSGIDTLRKKEELQKILAKYGLTDWETPK